MAQTYALTNPQRGLGIPLPNPNVGKLAPLDINSFTNLYHVARAARNDKYNELKLASESIAASNTILKDLKVLPKHIPGLEKKMIDYGLDSAGFGNVKDAETAMRLGLNAQRLSLDPEVRDWVKDTEASKLHDKIIYDDKESQHWMEMMGAENFKKYVQQVEDARKPDDPTSGLRKRSYDIDPASFVDAEAYGASINQKNELAKMKTLREQKLAELEGYKLTQLQEKNKILKDTFDGMQKMVDSLPDGIDKQFITDEINLLKIDAADDKFDSKNAMAIRAAMDVYIKDKQPGGANKYPSLQSVFDEITLRGHTYQRNTNASGLSQAAPGTVGSRQNMQSMTPIPTSGSVYLTPVDKAGNYVFQAVDRNGKTRNLKVTDKTGIVTIDQEAGETPSKELSFLNGGLNKTFHKVRAIDSRGALTATPTVDFVELDDLSINYGYDGVQVDANGRMLGILNFKSESDAKKAAKAFGSGYEVVSPSTGVYRITNKKDKNGDVVEMDLLEVSNIETKYSGGPIVPTSTGAKPTNGAVPAAPPAPSKAGAVLGDPEASTTQTLQDSLLVANVDGSPSAASKAYIARLKPEVRKALFYLQQGDTNNNINGLFFKKLVFTNINEGEHTSGSNHYVGNAIDLRMNPVHPKDSAANFDYLAYMQLRNPGWIAANNVELYFEDGSPVTLKANIEQLAKQLGGVAQWNSDNNTVDIFSKGKQLHLSYRVIAGVAPHIHMDIFPPEGVKQISPSKGSEIDSLFVEMPDGTTKVFAKQPAGE